MTYLLIISQQIPKECEPQEKLLTAILKNNVNQTQVYLSLMPTQNSKCLVSTGSRLSFFSWSEERTGGDVGVRHHAEVAVRTHHKTRHVSFGLFSCRTLTDREPQEPPKVKQFSRETNLNCTQTKTQGEDFLFYTDAKKKGSSVTKFTGANSSLAANVSQASHYFPVAVRDCCGAFLSLLR